MEKLDLLVEDLLLDLANPRLGGVGSQAEALRGLVELGTTYFRTLMLSIKENGLDPGDSFYVIASEAEADSFIVVDGNRRLAALKVLTEPAMLAGLNLSDSQQKSILKATEGFDPASLTAVSCVIFNDRASADEWIERRHGRDLGGEGRLTWSPLEIERFQKDRSTLDVIAFVERTAGVKQENWNAVRMAVEKSSSTLRRFLSSIVGQQWLGYSITTDEVDGGKVPAFSRDAVFVSAVLERIFGDIASGAITSRTHNTTDDIENYFKNLPPKLKPKGSPSVAPTRFRDVAGTSVNPIATAGVAADKTTRAKQPRRTLAPKKHLFSQPLTTKGQRLVLEASRILVVEFPLASAYLFRAFLEHTVDSYMETHNISRTEGKTLLDLNKRSVKVIEHLVTSGMATSQAMRGAKRVLTNTNDPSSIQALNDYHHDRYQLPAADALQNGWDACIPLFTAVYGSAK